jgi:hypothetical protein
MKTTQEITSDILVSLGHQNNPIGILLTTYLNSVITDIVREKLIEFQIELSDEGAISDCDWSFEEKANEFILGNPIKENDN